MFRHHQGWDNGGPHVLGALFLLIVLLGLAALVVWAVRRIASTPRPVAGPPSTGLPPRPDPALESARLRYARGEISREDYLRLAADLGAPVADPGPPPPPPPAV